MVMTLPVSRGPGRPAACCCCSSSSSSRSSSRLAIHTGRSSTVRVSATSRFEAANPFVQEMRATAAHIATRGKGILASDESNATTGKRLESVGVKTTRRTGATARARLRAWRELMYTAPGLGQYISGCIMFEDFLYSSTAAGVPFVDVLKRGGIVPGIKADTGMQTIPGTDSETATQGLDNLGSKCKEWYKQGARFAKWRAVLRIAGPGQGPSTTAISENAHGLARYAQIAQENGLVPIVEPEVTLGPGNYGIEETAFWSERVYSHVFRMLNEYNVVLDAILLKPNMCLPGLDAEPASPAEVARYTTRTMLRTIPAAVPGIHFLSGGMSEEESTLNLQALNEACPNAPWSLTFSYGRALQATTLKTWAGQPGNWEAAQKVLLSLAAVNSQAQLGQYKGPHPSPGGGRILQALRTGGAGK
ncbi:fructose-1,6-bisphosphate aldolase [Scenedesmus sp. NREL 46B-D3]|nr:fructose-1,6-bisphosphate aldolase [Scenedesmus sp. NREL 46B-D3]